MNEMTVPQFRRWLRRIDLGQWGWTPEHRKIGTYLIGKTKKDLRAHRAPDGSPWKDRYAAPRPRVGDEKTPMLLDNGRIVSQTIRSAAGKRRAVAVRKKYGPPLKPLKALVRRKAPGGLARYKAVKIWEFLTTRGRAFRMSKTHWEYGWTPGTAWVEKLHNGGTYLGNPVPARPILGLTASDIAAIEKIYAAGVDRRLAKAAAASAS